MKYVIILGDGMGDYPIDKLGGKTPLAVAKKPMMDFLAGKGEVGLVKTVPEGFTPGSDVANMGVLGYDVRDCYTGRSPLEALSMGVSLDEGDIAFRTNLVTLSDDEGFDHKKMVDYSAGEISTDEGAELIKAVAESLGDDHVKFYPGVSYRHLLVLKGAGKDSINDLTLTPPHNITGKAIAEHVYEKHQLLKGWLCSLGVPEEVAAEDACKMEHVISDESFDAIKDHVSKHK